MKRLYTSMFQKKKRITIMRDKDEDTIKERRLSRVDFAHGGGGGEGLVDSFGEFWCNS